MIEQIKKAEKQGFDLLATSFTKYFIGSTLEVVETLYYEDFIRFCYTHSNHTIKDQHHKDLSYYKLIFGTDFLDKLVGEGCADNRTLKNCWHAALNDIKDCIGCGHFYDIAKHHRIQLANMTLTEMIEYVGAL